MKPTQPVLYVIAGGGPPAAQLAEFTGCAQRQGWDVCVITSPDGARFLDTAELARLSRSRLGQTAPADRRCSAAHEAGGRLLEQVGRQRLGPG